MSPGRVLAGEAWLRFLQPGASKTPESVPEEFAGQGESSGFSRALTLCYGCAEAEQRVWAVLLSPVLEGPVGVAQTLSGSHSFADR